MAEDNFFADIPKDGGAGHAELSPRDKYLKNFSGSGLGQHLTDEEWLAANQDNPLRRGISDTERLMATNLFDTQPKRRAAFLKQIGFQMDPSDYNNIKVLGSKDDYDIEIDPQILPSLPQFAKLGEEWAKAGSKGSFLGFAAKAVGKRALEQLNPVGGELGKDILDLGGDVASGAAIGLGGSAGAAAGGGVTPMALVLGVLGGAAGNAVSEAVKKQAGDLILDPENRIPMDLQATAIQSFVAGALPVALRAIPKLGEKGAAEAIAAHAERARNNMANLAKKEGINLNADLVDAAMKNPESFTPEAVNGATGRIKDTFKSLFGIDPNAPITREDFKKLNPDSVFGQKIKPLVEKQQSLYAALDSHPNASPTIGEVIQPMENKILELSGRAKGPDEKAAIRFMEDQISQIKELGAEYAKKTGQEGVLHDVTIPFSKARQFLSIAQDYSAPGSIVKPEQPGAGIIRQAIGSGEEGLNTVLYNRAAQVEKNLGIPPEEGIQGVNKQISGVYDLFNQARENLKPDAVKNAFIGKDSVAKQNVVDTLKTVDQGLGTDLEKGFQTGAYQSEIDNLLKNKPAFGSGRSKVASEALKGGAVGFGIGAGAGAPVGMSLPAGTVGALIGAGRGARNALLAGTPEIALGNVVNRSIKADAAAEAANQIDPVSKMVSDFLTKQTPPQRVAEGIGTKLGTPSSLGAAETPPDEDFFADIPR